MPTNLPQRQHKTFLPLFLWTFVLVPIIYGIAAYEFISYEKSQLDAHRSHGGGVPISMSAVQR